MAEYRLTRPYFDGVLHSKGAVMDFPEGAAPSSARLVSSEAPGQVEEEKKAEAEKPAKAATASAGPKATVKKG